MKYDFPKVDLHFHLDGSMLPEVTWKLANERGIALPADSLEGFRKYNADTADCQDVMEYLSRFDLSTAILQDHDALAESAYTIIRHIAQQGLCYAEIRFAPQLHTLKGMSQNDAVMAVLDGVKQAEAECPSIKIGIILCCMIMAGQDNTAANQQTVALTEQWQGKGVVAVDLAGAEDSVPFESYAGLFTEYHKKGLPMTIHAGDNGKPANVATAIDWGASRIGHGHRCWENQQIVKKVIANDVALEICLTSNIQCKTEPSYRQHPAKKLYDAGVKVTLNTDNMVLANICLDDEYDKAISELGFTYNDIIRMNINSIESSFMPAEEKPAYIARLQACLK